MSGPGGQVSWCPLAAAHPSQPRIQCCSGCLLRRKFFLVVVWSACLRHMPLPRSNAPMLNEEGAGGPAAQIIMSRVCWCSMWWCKVVSINRKDQDGFEAGGSQRTSRAYTLLLRFGCQWCLEACRRSIAFCLRHCRLQNHFVTVAERTTVGPNTPPHQNRKHAEPKAQTRDN